jgi:tripartite-type tricarboxylate transporter receptor subunit TctC
MYDAIVKVMKDPDAVKRFADDGLVATASSPTEFAAFVAAEIAEWSKLVQEMKLPIVTLGK